MSYSSIRALLKDDRVHVAGGVVAVLDGDTSHYYVNEEGDVIVSCLMHQGGGPRRANMAALVGARGQGVWVIPDPGVEVMIGFDQGDEEGEAYLIACFPSGRSPAGLVPGKVFVIGMEIEARSANGTALQLAYKSDVEAVDAKYANHIHLDSVGGATTGPGSTAIPNPSPPPANLGVTPLSSANVQGTQVFKAE